MTDPASHGEKFVQLCRLAGAWRGGGQGEFPTIEDFRFEEQTTFSTRDEDEPTLHYEQRVWVIGADGQREPSHWETGYVQVGESGVIELLNAQNSGRVEVLQGDLEAAADGGWTLTLTSVLHGYDDRMVAAQRTYQLAGDELRYTVLMTTRDVATSTPHLTAILRRRSDSAAG